MGLHVDFLGGKGRYNFLKYAPNVVSLFAKSKSVDLSKVW